jgi:hypothetical protein
VTRRRDPGATFVEWCSTAPLDAVESVLAICRWTVTRRRQDEAAENPLRAVKRPRPGGARKPLLDTPTEGE